jgi:hypothetical protein
MGAVEIGEQKRGERNWIGSGGVCEIRLASATLLLALAKLHLLLSMGATTALATAARRSSRLLDLVLHLHLLLDGVGVARRRCESSSAAARRRWSRVGDGREERRRGETASPRVPAAGASTRAPEAAASIRRRREYLPRWRRGACEDGKISSSTAAGVVSSWCRRPARRFK